MEYKEDLRIVRTRKLLSATLLDMMEESSIEKISVIDLCKRAMVNRATFYAHFEDKYHLLSFALEELKEVMARLPRHAGRLLIYRAELRLVDAVEAAKLLLLAETDSVFALLAAARAVLAGLRVAFGEAALLGVAAVTL